MTDARDPKSTTAFAIVDKTNPEVLYGEGTFATADAAEETARNLNALLSVEARVYRAVAHVITDSLTIVGEDADYASAPARSAVQPAEAAPAAEQTVEAAPAAEQPAEAPAPVEAEQAEDVQPVAAVSAPTPAPVPSVLPTPIPTPHPVEDEAIGEPAQPGESRPADPFARR